MITSKQMNELEDYAESQGITALDLMENAGKEFVRVIKKLYHLAGTQIVVFAGPGHNGGDGLVIARLLAQEYPVIVLLFGEKRKLKEESQRQFEKLKNPITIIEIKKQDDLQHFHFQKNTPLVLIDALLGTGVKGPLRELVSLAIDYFNQLPGIKIAVDLPSGLDPDTGETHQKMCEVDLIVTFHDLKVGLEHYQRKTIVVDIGIPG